MRSKEGFAGRDFHLLRPTPTDASIFSWCGDCGTAEASDLGPAFRFGRVWNDAADEGLTLINPHTGTECVFAVDQVDRDADGDVIAWHLNGATRGKQHLYLTIFND